MMSKYLLSLSTFRFFGSVETLILNPLVIPQSRPVTEIGMWSPLQITMPGL